MKPKDLKAAFSWEERKPLIDDRVFHVPNYYMHHDSFSFPGWEDSSLFGNANPLCVEYCSGNGDWIVERAKQNPHCNWIAVEIRYDRVRKIWSKIKNESLSNLIVVCGEAWTFTHHYVAEDSIEEAYIHFPDPWPKEKHDKHRLMKPRFLDALARILKPGKQVTFVSDDTDYIQRTDALFSVHSQFSVSKRLDDLPAYGNSWFENLWREKGRKIHYLQYVST